MKNFTAFLRKLPNKSTGTSKKYKKINLGAQHVHNKV